MENAQQLVNGELGDIVSICVNQAVKTFVERMDKDTNPQIVQMIWRNELLNHWYYRSNEWIDQPYFIKDRFIQPYVGKADQAMGVLYGKGTYTLDESLTRIAQNEKLASFLIHQPFPKL